MSIITKLSNSRSLVARWQSVRRRWPVVDWAYQDFRRYGRISLSLRLRCPDVVFVPIVGMHRSGTSCVTGILAQNGLHLGDDLIDGSPLNPEGFWESAEAIQINEALLYRWKYDSFDPQGFIAHFPRRLLRRAESFLLRLASRPVVGWKDPRTTITWPAWHELLSKNRHVVVACFRHPRSAAKSFTVAEAGLPYETALECWRKFNSMVASIGSEVVLINFDEPLEPQIRYACRRLGLEFTPGSMSLYKPKLVHNHLQDDGSGSDEADSLYGHLLARWQSQRIDVVPERVEAL
ncbi:MAG: hypothetical protein ACLQGP_12475 [Isosphaeraceae bacterium]